MPNISLRPALTAAIVLLLLAEATSPCSAAPAEENATPPKAGSANAPEQKATPGAELTPKADKMPEATAAPTADLTGACKKAVTKLGAGDLSGLESLPSEKRAALVQEPKAVDAVVCLAIADDN